MDGNGRWAESRGMPRTDGHKAGKETARQIMRHVNRLKKVKVLTMYAFSTENWKRDGYEVDVLMEIIKNFAVDEIGEFLADGVKVRFIGKRDGLNPFLVKAMEGMEYATKGGTHMLLQMAVNYGGQDEILRTANKLRGATEPITSEQFATALDTSVEPVDVFIRTGGNNRLSNFLLWQAAYAEIFFEDVLWPDFTPERLDAILALYAKADRRFGGMPKATAAE